MSKWHLDQTPTTVYSGLKSFKLRRKKLRQTKSLSGNEKAEGKPESPTFPPLTKTKSLQSDSKFPSAFIKDIVAFFKGCFSMVFSSLITGT